MKRTLFFLIKAAVLVAAAVWLADRPGRVEIAWQGRIIETSVGMLVLAAALLMLLAALLYRLWRILRRAPERVARSRRATRREQGYRALTRGMVAVAAGDAEAAQRFSRKADVLLDEPPLTLLLSAQAAQLAGDETAATRYFEAMLTRPDTEFLGLRGLLNQSLKRQDPVRALDMARRARQLRPDTAWAQRACFELEVAQRKWDDAQISLAHAVRVKAIGLEEGRRIKTRLLVERSRAAEAAGDEAEALGFAHKAVGLDPDFVPAVLRESRLLSRSGRDGQAARLIEKTWSRAAHRDLAEAYAALGPAGEEPIAKVKRMEKLLRLRPDEPEALLAVAQAELDARLWGSARTHLLKVEQAAPGRRAYRMLADLETSERNDPIASRNWLAKAQSSAPEEQWVCEACGAAHPVWSALCGSCGAFDTIVWRAPSAMRAIAAPITMPMGAAPAGAAPGGVPALAAQAGSAAGLAAAPAR